MRRRAIQRCMLITFLFGAVTFAAACTVGPFEIALRDTAAQDTRRQEQIAATVTAVYATNTQIAALRTATAISATMQPAPTAAATTLPESAPGAVPAPPAADIRLAFQGEGLVLYNTSPGARDVSGLSFHSGPNELNISRWDNGFLSTSLFAFPAGDCLMAWTLNTDELPKPPDCGTRHAWIALSPAQAFWLTGEPISVRWYGQPFAQCAAGTGLCEFNLP